MDANGSGSAIDRRDFVRTTAAAGLGALGAMGAPGLLLGGSPGEKVVVAVIGVNGRGTVHAQNFSTLPNSEVAYVCDVDAGVVAKGLAAAKAQATPPKVVGDFRRVLDDRRVDAISIAAPDHWHAPMTLLALDAGKHVYVEKPSGHDPREDELLIAAAARTKSLVQLGTQRRSGPHFFDALAALRDGLIGMPYLARTWYANTRGGIGKGKVAAPPSGLNWELWQGPAPRTAYRDNVVHYNWHWFTRWGTGEICNNGTHEMDVARWLLGVDYPTSVVSSGTRWHFDDDWEFPDTQEATYEFAGGRSIVWHGQSCNGLPMYGRARGTAILGTAGSLVIDQDGYVFADPKDKVLRQSSAGPKGDALNVTGDDALTRVHMRNFLDAIRTGAKLNAPIADGAKTGLLCHLGTIAQQTGRKLRIDPNTGRILGDDDAMTRWSREYAPGWAPAV
ncbi:oxidoreductase domain protein [Gemmatirosa kalamazoonensis]|uniref:Oxidoreductase domain protein n=1 Tax=Gemmatirosa kalamazoonensis TaxID=861299 RepID=W0REB9_9BACT|nr:Gfo/Idh/MocA family oxidoreductase [Gemmatirosa kalamazoonensis]AHG89161.1 oxidoreductase domain protein [Gemmatirosa kalamazoonensis]